MSKQPNKTVIGAFVVGAIVLGVTGVLIFGSGKFFAEKHKYVLIFSGSVKGLNVGSPVMFRGVKTGSVTDILLYFNPEDLSVQIPVIIEVEPEKFKIVKGERRPKRNIKLLVEHGLKAQLQLQSMVTGQLMVNFDFKPDEPIKLSETKFDYPELPTIPSDMEKLARTIENIDFEGIITSLKEAVNGLEKVLNAPELIGSFKAIEKTVKDIDKLVKNVDKNVEPLVVSMKNASDAARSALKQAEKTLALEEGVPGELASGIKETLTSVQDVVSEDSNLVNELNNAFNELSSAARSIRFLADYLERHPEALLRGKGSSKGE